LAFIDLKVLRTELNVNYSLEYFLVYPVKLMNIWVGLSIILKFDDCYAELAVANKEPALNVELHIMCPRQILVFMKLFEKFILTDIFN
jgi:hypothetical protein